MPLQSSGIIVVEKPSSTVSSVCAGQQQQQQLLFATTTTSAATTSKPVAELQYCEYYEASDVHAQQQQQQLHHQQHAVVVEHSSNNTSQQQQHLIRRQQQRSNNSANSSTTIQQLNLKQQQSVQHMVHHAQPPPPQQQQLQQQQQQLQVSEDLYEQAAAAAGNMMISTTGEVLNQQYFKIVTPDGNTSNMIIGPMGNVTTTTSTGQNASAAAAAGNNNSSKVLLSNVTVLSKQSATSAIATQQQQQQQHQQHQQHQPQTINFVSTKNVSYLTTTTTTGVGGHTAGAATNGKQQQQQQQKLTSSSVASYKAAAKQHQHVINSASATSTTAAAFIQQSTQQQQQQQHTVQKLTVPRNVQMVARVQTLLPQAQQQQQQQQPQMIIQHQQQQQQQQITQKYVVPSTSKTGNVLKKSGSLKMSQHKGLNSIGQTGSIKTFIQQQQQPSGNNQQQQNNQYQAPNKIKSQKIVKQYNNVISNSTGAVSIATLPQQQHQTNHTALATYTINHKFNNHQQQQQPTKITKIANSKYVMHNNQQQQQPQQHHIITTSTTATLPHGTQIHHKPLQQHNSSSNNLMLQQLNSSNHGGGGGGTNAGTIKFVNAHGTVIHQQNPHHQHQQQPPPPPHPSQKQRHQQQQHKQQYAQQLQFVETSLMAGDSIYQMSTTAAAPQQQSSPASSTSSSSCSQSLLSDDIMIVNGTQMTDELSARILQSMAQNSFGNQQRYHQQQQQQQHQPHQHQTKGSAAPTNMPPPQQIVLQHHGGSNMSPVPHHQLLSPKEYPIYNPLQHQQQQYVQQQQPTSYFGASCSALNSGVTAGGVGVAASGRQNQSAPASRSHSIERKLHETSVAKKSSDYFKVNTGATTRANISGGGTGSAAMSSSQVSNVSLDSAQQPSTVAVAVAKVSSSSAAASSSSGHHHNNNNNNDDDNIIGEEVRPVPVNTHDMRLRILQAVLQDHTYANPTPTRFPTDLTAATVQSTTDAAPQVHAGASSTSGYVTLQQQTGTGSTPHWSLGGIGATVGQSVAGAGAGASAAALVPTTLNAQTLITSGNGGGATSYTLYGQQIPRLQQDDDANSAISNGSRVAAGDIDPGEETETAPEAEDDSVTRCICDLTHDDGYMICCDKCSAWQHVDCMGIDRQNIPDEYLCEVCQPRPVDKERARALQFTKRKEQQTHLLLSSQAPGGGGMGEGSSSVIGSGGNDAVSLQQHRLGAAACGGLLFANSNDLAGRGSLSTAMHGSVGGAAGTATGKKGKVLKKTKDGGAAASNKKSKKTEKGGTTASAGSGKGQRKETKKNTKRKTKNSDGLGSGGGGGGGTAAERHAANLRQWIENYELAATNHYSPELRARLQAISKQPNLLHSMENKALKNCGNLDSKASTVPHAGGKILVSNLDIAPNCPIFELRGKFMLTTQYRTQNSSINMNSPPPSNYLAGFKPHRIPGPFIFFHQLPVAELGVGTADAQSLQAFPPPSHAAAQHLKGPEICVDTRTYGNEARFVRRSCRPNAEIQHLFEKGTIHLFIVSLIDIRASTEITIRHEPHDLLAIEHRKSSQLVIQPTSTPCACGLSKDCLFGPPLQQSPAMASAASKAAGRKAAITVNGSSAAALQLTMGGLPAPGVPPAAKKKAQNFNRNRSTSSSGDSNMGLNSPGILPLNSSNSNNNLKNANMLGACVPFMSATAAASMSMLNPMHDSGICTSSSSPSVSIPSPSSHIHSPTQQQQQQQQQHLCLQPPLQQTTAGAVVQQQRTLVMQQPLPQQSQQQPQQQQQQQQHHEILAALPTTMLLSPHQILQQQQSQTLNAVAANAAAAVPIVATAMPPAPEDHVLQQHTETSDDPSLSPQEPHNVFVQIAPPALQAAEQIVPLHNPETAETANVFAARSNLVIPASLLPAAQPNKATGVAHQPMTAALYSSNDTATAIVAKEVSAGQQQLQQQQQQKPHPHNYPQKITSPISSPQKGAASATVNTAASAAPNSARKNSTRHQNLSRTTSISEDPATAPEGQHNQQPPQMDCDTTASTQSPSSSNNTSLTSPKEKPKLTRDERKMEAILRAIEKMEKTSQRKLEPKQTKRVTKRRQSNTSNAASPTLLEKQRVGAAGDGNAAASASAATATGALKQQSKKSSTAYSSSRKKKRKSHKKSYNMHSSAAQRKRRKSRLNSSESATDAAAAAENAPAVVDANTDDAGNADIAAIVATSESESSCLLSPSMSMQTVAGGAGSEYNIQSGQQQPPPPPQQQQQIEDEEEEEEQHQRLDNDCNSGGISIPNKSEDSAAAATNVDHAAGLLMAFANNKNTIMSCPQEDDDDDQQQQKLVVVGDHQHHHHHSQVQYILHDDEVFKSPNRLQSSRDATVAASPPPTPPAPVSSACLLLEAAVGPLEPLDSNEQVVEFKYPPSTQTKTKKVLMSNWFHQSDVADITGNAPDACATTAPTHAQTFSAPQLPLGLDSLVQAAMSDYKPQEEVENLSMVAKQVEEFIQQTECPTATAAEQQQNDCVGGCSYRLSTDSYQTLSAEVTSSHYASSSSAASALAAGNLHLPLQVSTCSNNSSVKKRWLRQAISEETDESSPTSAGALNASPLPNNNNYPVLPNGFTTPLKKRRLVISSKEEEEGDSGGDNTAVCALSMTPSPPPASLPPLVSGAVTATEMAPLYPTPENIKLEADLETSRPRAFEMNIVATHSAAYAALGVVDGDDGHADNRDDESEIVDVGSCELTSSFTGHAEVTPHARIDANFDDNEDDKAPASALAQQSPPPSPPRLQTTDFKTEMVLEQDDDVDILRSPSPGSQKMVAEDNLVKIEPEDVSGGDDVKIDVEREESVTFDKFEEIIQLKREKEHSKLEDKDHDNAAAAAVMNTKGEAMETIKSEKQPQEGDPSEEIEEEKTCLKTTKVTIVEISAQPNSFESKLPQLLDEISPKLEEPVKKKPKIEMPQESLLPPAPPSPSPPASQMPEMETGSSQPTTTAAVVTAAVTAVTISEALQLPPPPPPPPSSTTPPPPQELTQKTCFVDSRVSAFCNAAESSLPSPSNSKSAVVPFDACHSANADNPSNSNGNGNANANTRRSLSDDDIQERLHSFHKENILFLQSRNKKTKVLSSSPLTPYKTTDSRHSMMINESKNSTSTSTKKFSSLSTTTATASSSSSTLKSINASSSSARKLLKKDRSSNSNSSGSRSSSTKSTNGTDSGITSLHSSSSSSSSISKKTKSLKKSHSITSSSGFSSSTVSSSLSLLTPTITTASHKEKEKNRRRSVSTSSASATASPCLPPPPAAKKRQLNFEQELSKDLLMCSSSSSSGSGGNSTSVRCRRDEAATSASSSGKKRRESSSGVGGGSGSRADDMRSSNSGGSKPKQQTATSNFHNTEASNKKPSHSADAQAAAVSLVTTTTALATVADSKPAATETAPMAAVSSINNTPSSANSEVISYTQSLPPIILASDVANVSAVLDTPTPITTTTTPTTSPPLAASKVVANSLPYYNTIYGKLLDNSHQQISAIPASASSIEVVVSSNRESALPAATNHSSGCAAILSEYLDTKAKSYNTLGGYVSHTAALFGLSAERKSTSGDADCAQLNSNPTSALTTAATAISLDSLQTCSASAAASAAAISLPKLPTPIKILTKTASHDPRLNPILSAPEPPPAPKRKLSINEYRKRKQQTTSTDNLTTSSYLSSSKEKLTAFLHTPTKFATDSLSQRIGGGLSSAVVGSSNSNNNNSSSSSSSLTNIYISTINKCTLNSPERFEIIKELHEKSLNESILSSGNSSSSNSSLSFANVEIPRMRISEEDTSKVQFSAAPTLLEKQQENLCERLKSLKKKQSAADLVTGRLAAIDKDFSLRKDNDLFHNRSTLSDLDNCLEAISSSSTSMTSSRESTPERQRGCRGQDAAAAPATLVHLSNRQYNETVNTKSDSSRKIGENHHQQQQHSAAVSTTAPATAVVETTATATTPSASAAKRSGYDLK